MTDQDVAATFEAFLRARGGRFEPLFANHSHAERTANLRQHRANRRSQRRRTQNGVRLFAGLSDSAMDAGLVAALEPPHSTCGDPLARNTGQPVPCTYDCADLRDEYFPGQQSRCFLFDTATNT